MKRVLIIDDEVDLCVLIQHFLTNKKYEVFIAHNLKDGFLLLKTVQPDSLFLDNNLPDGMGWDFADAIQLQHPNLNITLISAYNYPNISHLSKHKKINILEKPISLYNIEQYI